MKTAVVYYTYDGNCKFVSRQIAALLKADVVQLQTVDEKRRSGFGKIVWGGMQAAMGKKPPLKPYSFDPAAYDLIILGTPVWAGSPAPALKTFLFQTKINGKKTALFACHGGGPGRVMKKLKALLKDNTIVSELCLRNPVQEAEKAIQQVEAWVKTLS